MNSNILNSNGGATYQDAFKIAVILTIAAYFTVFMPLWGLEAIEANPVKFCYDTIQFAGASVATQFVFLSGLNKYTQPKKEEPKEPS